MRTVVGNQLTSIISHGKCNFKDLTISCIQGQVVGIVGSDPSGLSQLMGIMAGHLNPVSGRVLFDGSELGQKGGEVSYPLEMFSKGLIHPSVGFLERIFSSSKYTLSRADLVLRFFPALKKDEVKKGSKLTGQDKAPVRLSHYLSFSHKAFYLDFPFEGFNEEQTNTSLKLVRELADRFKDLILINGCDLEKLKTVCDVIYSIDTNAEVFEKNPKPVFDDSPEEEIAK